MEIIGVIRMGRFDFIRKRFTRTTFGNVGNRFGTFDFNSKSPYGNETTWLTLYQKEPFIRGAIDAIVNAVIGEWTLESVSEKESPSEKKLIENIKADLTNPRMRTEAKLRTMAYKLIIDTVLYIETSRVDMDFYVLDSEDCTLRWDDNNKYIIGVDWKKHDDPSMTPPEELRGKEYAFASLFDPDTNLFKASPLETLIDIGNIFYHSRKYNLDIFEKGGVPSSMITVPESTTTEQIKRLERLIRRSKSGSNIIAKGDVKIQQLAGFTKDMEYDILVEHGIQSVMTLLNITPIMMNFIRGSGSGGGGESSKQEMNAFAIGVHAKQRTINSIMTQIIHNLYSKSDEEEGINRRVGRPKSDVYNIRFKLRKWVDSRQQAAIHKIYLDTKVLTRNEVREDLGRELHEDADEFLSGGAGAMGNIGAPNVSGQDRTNEPNQNPDDRNRPSDIQDAEKQ